MQSFTSEMCMCFSYFWMDEANRVELAMMQLWRIRAGTLAHLCISATSLTNPRKLLPGPWFHFSTALFMPLGRIAHELACCVHLFLLPSLLCQCEPMQITVTAWTWVYSQVVRVGFRGEICRQMEAELLPGLFRGSHSFSGMLDSRPTVDHHQGLVCYYRVSPCLWNEIWERRGFGRRRGLV